LSTNFPTSLDTFTDPSGTTGTSTPSHAGGHDNINDAILALETKVGINGSTVTTTLDYKTTKAALLRENVNTVASSGTACTLPDVTTATLNSVTLTGNCTFTFPTAAAGKGFAIQLTQDSTGSRTATWPATVKWSNGTAPTLSTTPGHADVVSFLCTDGSTWLGNHVPPSTSGGSSGGTSTKAILWSGADAVASMTQANWNTLSSWGFDGVIAVMGGSGQPAGLPWGPAASGTSEWGGGYAYGASPGAGTQWNQQKALGQSGSTSAQSYFAHHATPNPMKVYLGFYLENNNDRVAPCTGDWFASSWTDWETTCHDIAAGAAWMGFDGLAFDTEGDGAIDWSWNYSGNTHTQAQTNTQAKSDGASMMTNIVSGFGSDCECLIYCSLLTGAQIAGGYYDTWATWYDANESGTYGAASGFVFQYFVAGLASNTTAAVVCGNALFYDAINVTSYGPYGSHGNGSLTPWADALSDEVAGQAAFQTLFGYTNVYLSPFVWLTDNSDAGQGQWTQAEWDAAAPTIQAKSQDNTFLVYQQAAPTAINYSSYNGVNYTPVDGGSGGGGGSAPTFTMATGFPVVSGTNPAPTSVSYTVQQIGDLIVIAGEENLDQHISAVSGGGVTTWHQVTFENNGQGFVASLWYGVSTSTGSVSATLTWATGGSSHDGNVAVFEVTPSKSVTWALSTDSTTNSASSATITWPNLSSGSSSSTGYCYFGVAGFGGSTPTGGTAGFTFANFASGGGDFGEYCYNLALALSTGYTPSISQVTGAAYNAVGAIFSAS